MPMRPMVAVGFGRYFRERLFGALAASTGAALDVRVVTCLKNGWEEFRELVAPEFTARALPEPKYIADLSDAIKLTRRMDGWGAAVINTPPAMHYSQASACIDGGLDVYIERPIVTNSDDLLSLVDAAERHGVQLFTGSQRRLEAPYQYIHDVVVHKIDFGQLVAVHCFLSVGERPTGWRKERELAGGGVLLDSGYHLLDCAAWIVDGAGDRFDAGSVRYAYLGGESYASNNSSFLESTAVGHVRTDRGVRDQAARTTEPGKVTHQRADGTIVLRAIEGRMTRLDGALISGGPGNAKPLAYFVKSRDDTAADVDLHPCSGRSAITSWRLVRDIYREASMGCDG